MRSARSVEITASPAAGSGTPAAETCDRSPRVSIILPTYNRARFLPEAFTSIGSQTLSNWELIVIDDGSTDRTEQVVAGWRQHLDQPLVYVKQPNAGPAAARNRGLQHASAPYIAFYDSDDIWLPHHLETCVSALDANADLDWIYGSCRIVRCADRSEVASSTFRVNGRERPFLSLRHEQRGALRKIVDPSAARFQILHGLYCGLQSSVIRAHVFQKVSIPDYRAGEDQALVVQVLLAGFALGYFDRVHVEYRIHEDNSSGASGGQAFQARSIRSVIRAHEDLLRTSSLPAAVRRALYRRIAADYFWKLGYGICWTAGDRNGALAYYRKAIRYWPWDWRYWKTYGLARVRSVTR